MVTLLTLTIIAAITQRSEHSGRFIWALHYRIDNETDIRDCWSRGLSLFCWSLNRHLIRNWIIMDLPDHLVSFTHRITCHCDIHCMIRYSYKKVSCVTAMHASTSQLKLQLKKCLQLVLKMKIHFECVSMCKETGMTCLLFSYLFDCELICDLFSRCSNLTLNLAYLSMTTSMPFTRVKSNLIWNFELK